MRGVREAQGAERQLTSSKGPARMVNSPPLIRDSLPSKDLLSLFSLLKKMHLFVMVCVCKIKKNSLCRLKINHALGLKTYVDS
jgi:hypothetical protein